MLVPVLGFGEAAAGVAAGAGVRALAAPRKVLFPESFLAVTRCALGAGASLDLGTGSGSFASAPCPALTAAGAEAAGGKGAGAGAAAAACESGAAAATGVSGKAGAPAPRCVRSPTLTNHSTAMVAPARAAIPRGRLQRARGDSGGIEGLGTTGGGVRFGVSAIGTAVRVGPASVCCRAPGASGAVSSISVRTGAGCGTPVGAFVSGSISVSGP